jgi:hypothetical protein
MDALSLKLTPTQTVALVRLLIAFIRHFPGGLRTRRHAHVQLRSRQPHRPHHLRDKLMSASLVVQRVMCAAMAMVVRVQRSHAAPSHHRTEWSTRTQPGRMYLRGSSSAEMDTASIAIVWVVRIESRECATPQGQQIPSAGLSCRPDHDQRTLSQLQTQNVKRACIRTACAPAGPGLQLYTDDSRGSSQLGLVDLISFRVQSKREWLRGAAAVATSSAKWARWQ